MINNLFSSFINYTYIRGSKTEGSFNHYENEILMNIEVIKKTTNNNLEENITKKNTYNMKKYEKNEKTLLKASGTRTKKNKKIFSLTSKSTSTT